MVIRTHSARIAFAALLSAATLGGVQAARADLTLTSGNTTAVIETGNSNGVSSWTVDGVSQIFQQWFWFRTSPTSREYSIENLFTTMGGTRTEGSISNVGVVTYQAGTLSIQVTFTLIGGSSGSGTADLAEQIHIFDSRGLAGMSFFQYADFNLGGTANDDSIQFTNANTVQQFDGSGASISETSDVPTPSRHQAGLASVILAGLNDGVATNLNGNNTAGPGDVAWAFQWDSVSGNDLIISKDMHIQIPAPGASLLATLGLGLVGWMKRRVA